jgi:hypothetical protein
VLATHVVTRVSPPQPVNFAGVILRSPLRTHAYVDRPLRGHPGLTLDPTRT